MYPRPPADGRGACDIAGAQPAWSKGARAVAQAFSSHTAGDCRRLLLRLDSLAVPELGPLVLLPELPAGFDAIGAILGRRFFCRRDRRYAWRRGERPHPAPVG